MRTALFASLITAAAAAALPALAQADRYGGVSAYPQPAYANTPAPPPSRVLAWPGKTMPPAGPPQANGYGYGRYVQAQPAYGAQLQPAPYAQARGAPPAPYAVDRRATLYPQPQQGYAPQQAYMAPPQGYMAPPQAYPAFPQPASAPLASYPSGLQPQPYYAPAPGMAAPPPGSTATAPNGVYPANTVPPQYAQPLVGQPTFVQPSSIYAVPSQGAPQAAIPQFSAPQFSAPQPELNGSPSLSGRAGPDPTETRAQQLAMAMGPPQTARLYSVHRQFGLQPDPTPMPAPEGQTVELVSLIDSPPGADPAAEQTSVRTRQTDSKGRVTTKTAQLRGDN